MPLMPPYWAVRCCASRAIAWRIPVPPQCFRWCVGQAIRVARCDCSAQHRHSVAVFRVECSISNSLRFGPFHQFATDIFRSTIHRMMNDLPRYSMIWFTLRMTRSAGSGKSTAMPSPSRLKSSKTFNSRNYLPSSKRSAMKSMDQTKFGASSTDSASGLSRFNHLLGLILRFNSSSRYTRLRFQRCPRTLRR